MSGRRSNERAIAERRRALRGGRSIREVCRDQYALDQKNGDPRIIRNRKSWARQPLITPKRVNA